MKSRGLHHRQECPSETNHAPLSRRRKIALLRQAPLMERLERSASVNLICSRECPQGVGSGPAGKGGKWTPARRLWVCKKPSVTHQAELALIAIGAKSPVGDDAASPRIGEFRAANDTSAAADKHWTIGGDGRAVDDQAFHEAYASRPEASRSSAPRDGGRS